MNKEEVNNDSIYYCYTIWSHDHWRSNCLFVRGSTLVGFLLTDTAMQALAQKMLVGIAKYSLLPLPFFVFSGNLMGQGGISKRLINFVQAATGHITGGVAIVTIISQ